LYKEPRLVYHNHIFTYLEQDFCL